MPDNNDEEHHHHHHHHHHLTEEEREKKRLKQQKRLGRILERAWQLPKSEPFQEDPRSSVDCVLSLESVGQKIDADAYKLGKHGWIDFAKDIGGVYNRHIKRCVFCHVRYDCPTVRLSTGFCQSIISVSHSNVYSEIPEARYIHAGEAA